MFKTNVRLLTATNAIIAHVNSLQRGDTLLHEKMIELGGISKSNSQWPGLCAKVKKEVRRNRGIVLWAVPNVGYRLITKDEQLKENPSKRLKRSQRQAWSGYRETDSLPNGELSLHQRQMKVDTIARIRKVRRIALQESRMVGRRTETAPIRPKRTPIRPTH